MGLNRGHFRALGASEIWFVADVPKLTTGEAADAAVEVAADGSLLGWLGRFWLDGSAGEGLGLASGGEGG